MINNTTTTTKMLVIHKWYMLIPQLYRYSYVGISDNRAEVNISMFFSLLFFLQQDESFKIKYQIYSRNLKIHV